MFHLGWPNSSWDWMDAPFMLQLINLPSTMSKPGNSALQSWSWWTRSVVTKKKLTKLSRKLTFWTQKWRFGSDDFPLSIWGNFQVPDVRSVGFGLVATRSPLGVPCRLVTKMPLVDLGILNPDYLRMSINDDMVTQGAIWLQRSKMKLKEVPNYVSWNWRQFRSDL